MCYRDFGPCRSLAEHLSSQFTVYFYDRRGRGDSGNTLPYAPEREFEDLAAVIEAAGGDAFVTGFSSGGGLVLRAAAAGVPMKKLASYEAPFIGQVIVKGKPVDELSRIRVPALVMVGGKAKPNMVEAVRAVAAAVPGSVHRTLPGQTHQVRDDAIAPQLVEFFA